MKRIETRWIGVGILALVLLSGSFVSTFAQAGRPDATERQRGRQGDRQVDREEMRQRLEEMRQRQQDRLRQSLGLSEEEFEVVQPMMEQVQGYMRDRQVAAMGRDVRDRQVAVMGRDMRAAFVRGPAQESLSEQGQALRTATQELHEAIAEDATSPEQLEEKLETLRSARSELDAALQRAREELREVLTLRQEAVLVSQGMLD